jgi:YgiT-type zinc finger domain-containing protein
VHPPRAFVKPAETQAASHTRAVIVVVRNVPAQVCDRCGTTTLTDEVAEELERIADAQQGRAVSGSVVVDFEQRQIAAAG